MEQKIKAILRTRTTEVVKTKELIKLFDQQAGLMLLEASGIKTKQNGTTYRQRVNNPG